MYVHIRKYQLVNARWRDVIDLTDYEETNENRVQADYR